MYSPCIVPNQIIYDLVVENIRIEQFFFVEINEFILQGPIESLAVSVHLGSLGIGMEMNHMQLFQFLGKVFGEFRSVVSEDEFDGEWKYLEAHFKEFSGSQRGVGFGAPGKAESGVDVLEGNYVSPIAVQMLLNSVQSHKMAWIENLEIFGLSELFAALQGLYLAEMRDFLRKYSQAPKVFDNSPNG